MKIIQSLRNLAFIFPRRDKQKLLLVSLIQILLSILDLIGVAIMGVIGAIAIYGIQSRSAGDRVLKLLEYLNLDDLTFQNQIAYLGLAAVFIFLFKTVVSIYLTKKSLRFISRRGAQISTNLVNSLFSKPISHLNKYTHQELIYTITTGIDSITIRVVGSALIIITDISLLIVLFLGMSYISTSISLSVLVSFGIIGYIVNKFMKKRAYALGANEAGLGIASNEKIAEALTTYRESIVRNRRLYYVNAISKLRFNLAGVTAEKNFMPHLNKYIMELTLIFGALMVSGVQFVLNDATRAIANLVVFLAAATRIAPAILRIQQSLLILRGGLGTVENTIKIIKEASVGESQDLQDNTPDFKYLGFNSSIVINNLKFAYGDSNQFQLSQIDLFVAQGEHIAISGSSGAGKTTLVDLILGVLTPTKGSIEISGVNPLHAFKQWPGATAYVPQDIVIVNGTIWENIALGFSFDQNHESHIWDALKLAHLDDYVRNLPEGLFTQVGERGYKLSGGQRQRLGIARALYTKPKILVMDEATSALDGETESDIANAIKSLRGKTTVLIIAHRLSSVRNADQVVFMSNGSIIAKGTFTQVREIAPEFDRQANLMGL